MQTPKITDLLICICLAVLSSKLTAQETDVATKAKIEQRDQFWKQALAVTKEGKLDEATALFEKVYSLEQSIFGPASKELLGTLDQLVKVAELQENSESVITIRKRQHQITEQIYGKLDYRTQDALRTVTYAQQDASRSREDRARLQQVEQRSQEMVELYGKGDFAAAIEIAEQAIEVTEAVLGKQHADYAGSLNNAAMLYQSMGKFPRAEPLYRQAIDIKKNVLGEQHPSYADSLDSLGRLYESMGDFPQSEPLFRQAIQIRKDVLGDQDLVYASSLNNLAALYKSMGDYSRAEPLFREAMEICKAVLGEQHSTYAITVNNLALLYQLTGDYSKAEPLCRQVVEIFKATLGEQHPTYATSLANLAGLYDTMGDYSRAEPLYRQVIKIEKAVLGEQHPNYARTLNNLATLYKDTGDYPRAEKSYLQVLGILKTVHGEQHPDYAQGLNNLATVYKSTGDYARAEPLLRQAMEIQEALLGQQNPTYAVSLSNLAGLYKLMGDYPRAEPLYRQAMEIRQAVLGEQHPSYAYSLNNLATLYFEMSDSLKAEPMFAEAIEITLRTLEQTASVQTESQQITMSQSLRRFLDNSIDCGLAMDPQPQAIVQQVTDWKGAVFVRGRGLRLAATDPAIADSFRSLQSVTQKLSSLTTSIPEPGKREAWQRQLTELTRERERLDAQLMRDSAAFRSAQKRVTLDQIREAIPRDGAIVNYLKYANGEKGQSLVAIVMCSDSDPVMIDLGSSADAAEAIEQWRQTLGADDAAQQAGIRIRKQIWEPLLTDLGEASPIFVSTDGALGQLPFIALPGKTDGSYLIEDHSIVMLPVPKLLPQLMQHEASELRTAVLMGDIDYDSEVEITPLPTPQNSNSSESLLLASRSLRDVRAGETYSALPATGKEIDAIADLFRDNHTATERKVEIFSLRGRGATDANFRELAENTRWMHLATHGFFAGADKKNALVMMESESDTPELANSRQSGAAPEPPVGFSPGSLSGLVFAGANRWSSDDATPPETLDDGIMTADEIMYLRLENVELAVLSACETGLGETAGGEGILGLQRAFQVAGARSTITSLWKVDDEATRALMVEFYRNRFERKLSKLESLRQAQLWMLNNPKNVISDRSLARGKVRQTKPQAAESKIAQGSQRSLPAYWAAFQLSGDPR